MTATRGELRAEQVLEYLRRHPDVTLAQISKGTGLTKTACSQAIYTLRQSLAITVAVGPEFTYRVAETVKDTIPGLDNQVRHIGTRGGSIMTLGDQQLVLAKTAQDVNVAELVKKIGESVVVQAEILAAALRVI